MIELIEGNSADFDVEINLEDLDYDLTSHKIWFTLKNNMDDPDSAALILVTTENQISITDAAAGLIRIALTPIITFGLPTDVTLFCDIQIRTPAGKVYTIFLDTVIVSKRVTKALDF